MRMNTAQKFKKTDFQSFVDTEVWTGYNHSCCRKALLFDRNRRSWRNWQTRTFEGRVSNHTGSSPVDRTNEKSPFFDFKQVLRLPAAILRNSVEERALLLQCSWYRKHGGNVNNRKYAILMAILAAVLYGISAPVSKLLLVKIHPTLMAALLYLGAGLGMLVVNGIRSFRHKTRIQAKLTRKELPYVIGMIILDIAAPILLMIALTLTSAANTSLINNFEIVATALIALFLFKEAIGRHMWIAITLITLGCIFLSISDAGSMDFSIGSLFAVLACICWGFENNLTRKLSLNDPLIVVVIKGFGSGIGSLIIAIAIGRLNAEAPYWVIALILGFVAYGLSIFFYISAQRTLGAARTSAYYAVAPFIGVLLSMTIFGQKMTMWFIIACVFMIAGASLAVLEHIKQKHALPGNDLDATNKKDIFKKW